MRQDMTTATAVTPSLIVRVYLVISGFFTLAASVIWGVNTLFLLDAGMDIFQSSWSTRRGRLCEEPRGCSG
jgi:hypothetical protein